MKHTWYARPSSVGIVLVLAALAAGPAAFLAQAQSSTDDKIHLMTEALQARDAGDYALARQRLFELQKIAPADPTVKGTLSEVDAKIVAEPVSVAAQPVDEDADATARAENDRLHSLIEAATMARRTARDLAKDRRFDEAVTAIDRSATDLPVNALTQKAVNELRETKADILLAQTRHLLNSGVPEAARVALASYQQIKPDDRVGTSLAREIDHAATKAAPAVPAVTASEPTVSVSTASSDAERLLAKARSQYIAGAPEAALQSYQGVLAIDPDNAEARRFISRIESEMTTRGAGTRDATRTALLAEVDKSWQRPSVYREQAQARQTDANAAPLLKKINDIVLPNVSFTKVEIDRVVSALSAASEEFDASGASPRGVNIVLLDPAAQSPTVTLTLRNTSLKRVLDFVTQAVGYQCEVQADAVVVRPGGESTTLDTAFFPVSRATVLRMTGAGATTPAKPAGSPFSSSGSGNDSGGGAGSEAPAMQAFLQQAGVNFDATEGSSLAYDGSSIIVTQTARNLERIRNILNRYNDIRQVEIEAKFMEVQEGTLDELGVNWNVATKATQLNAGARALYQTSGRSLLNAFSSSVTGQQGSIVRPDAATTNADGEVSVTPGLNVPIDYSPPSIPGAAYLGAAAGALANVTGVIGEFDVNAVVRALSQKQGTDLLSAPKVTVLSGNPATITVAQELRYPQSFGQTQSQVGTGNASGGGSAGVAITAGTPQEFATRNVGVELKVTPTVEEDDYSISLDLNPKVTEFDGFVEYGGPSVAISGSTTVNVPSGFYQPIFSVRDISTKVTIWDGATLIMGGLTREEVKKVNDKVPLLGDIPVLGRMFKSRGDSAQKRNLLIFVTASLLSPGGSPKKQALRGVAPSSLFQNPVIVTPGGAEPRASTAAE